MWVIQGEIMISLPDGAPLPPGSTPVDLPAGFESDPRGFVIQDGKLLPFERPQRKPKLKLSQKDIARIKAAIKAGIL